MLLLVCGLISAWTLVAAAIRYNGETHSRLIQIAKKQKNFARTVRESERADSWYFPIDETATPFTWYRGMALFYSGQATAAKVAYEDALKKNPYHIQLLNDLATAFEQTHERGRAVEFYRRALAITPNFPHSLLNISACYFNLGKKDSAYIYIDKVYGLKLTYKEMSSYKVYLPAILREKVNAERHKIPEPARERAMTMATDTAFLATVYRKAKQKNMGFIESLADSLKRIQ